ncbi:PIG-L family deacetylase [Legionella sp. WA2024007413]
MKLYNILIIGSSADVVNKITNWLKKDMAITTAKDLIEAKDLLQKKHWNLVITDINLENSNVLEITKMVKISSPFTPVLIITANQKIDFILAALEFHADALVFRPLEKNKLVETVYKLVNEARPSREKQNVILAIGAHPDDVEIGCGGSLVLHQLNQDSIHILTLSLGERGGDPQLRKIEAEQAARELNANLYLYNLMDTQISNTSVTINYIEKVIKEVNPTHIYTHSLHDSHQDHRNVHHATLVAARKVKNIYCYASPSSTVNFKPNLFIDIKSVLERKLEIIALYKSQSVSKPYLSSELVCATAAFWGRYINYSMAEAMEVIRQQQIS